MTTIDNIVKQQGLLGQIEFLKLDIQGAELLALQGALETIQSSVEFILCEASIIFPSYNSIQGLWYDVLLTQNRDPDTHCYCARSLKQNNNFSPVTSSLILMKVGFPLFFT